LNQEHIDTRLASKLICSQFSQWAHLPIKPVERSGWDNRTFRLGEQFLIRMPSAKSYAPQVDKEQLWLPYFTTELKTITPTVKALGQPEFGYPWRWSVYEWIAGQDALDSTKSRTTEFAFAVARFLNEYHQLHNNDGPPAGTHNYFRGGELLEYDSDTRRYVKQLSTDINAQQALSAWELALVSRWDQPPVWLHGDLEASNILITASNQIAVIDFGNCAVGDPACDLVMAWSFFNDEQRNCFRTQVNIDAETWNRGRGWALWKALFRMNENNDPQNEQYQAAKRVLERTLAY